MRRVGLGSVLFQRLPCGQQRYPQGKCFGGQEHVWVLSEGQHLQQSQQCLKLQLLEFKVKLQGR